MEIIEKINSCDTMPELDELRSEVVRAMRSDNGKDFETIQKSFIKKKNKLKRIPLKDRSW